MVTWTGPQLGLETRSCQPRAALAVEGSENAGISTRGSGAAREAERDPTGSFSVQPPVHTWIGPGVQGSVAARQTSSLVTARRLKLQF